MHAEAPASRDPRRDDELLRTRSDRTPHARAAAPAGPPGPGREAVGPARGGSGPGGSGLGEEASR